MAAKAIRTPIAFQNLTSSMEGRLRSLLNNLVNIYLTFLIVNYNDSIIPQPYRIKKLEEKNLNIWPSVVF